MRTLRRMKIEVYGHDECPYCLRAKALLQDKGWNYIYYDIKRCPERAKELSNKMKSFGVKNITVPQIFINEDSIGGFSDLTEYIADINDGRTVS